MASVHLETLPMIFKTIWYILTTINFTLQVQHICIIIEHSEIQIDWPLLTSWPWVMSQVHPKTLLMIFKMTDSENNSQYYIAIQAHLHNYWKHLRTGLTDRHWHLNYREWPQPTQKLFQWCSTQMQQANHAVEYYIGGRGYSYNIQTLLTWLISVPKPFRMTLVYLKTCLELFRTI